VPPRTLRDRIDHTVFNAIYARSLVYNTCWEDPAVDLLALDLGPDDTLLVITSAGCNVLDYAVARPRRIHAVDANPRQTALLELKLAGIRRLGYEDFFAPFGMGVHADFRDLYQDALRRDLWSFARTFWDQCQHWFAQTRADFASRGWPGPWRVPSMPTCGCARVWPRGSAICFGRTTWETNGPSTRTEWNLCCGAPG
jgi:S-adenosylmethionine-diacylglycerol 3-amino-3-carboxypropyl transferase